MKKVILTFLVFILFGLGAYASIQKNIELNPNETKYIDPYVLTNETNKKIFAPYTDINNFILGNTSSSLEKFDKNTNQFLGTTSLNNLNKVSFGIGNKLGGKYNIGGFSIKDATYKRYSSYGSCSAFCGSGIKYILATCKRDDDNSTLSNEEYCDILGGTKPSGTMSCTAAQTSCISYCNSSVVGKYRSDGKICTRSSYSYYGSYACSKVVVVPGVTLCAVSGLGQYGYCETTPSTRKRVYTTCYGTITSYTYSFR